MTFLKHSFLASTSLLFGIHSAWAVKDDFGDINELQAGIQIKKSRNSKNYTKKNVKEDTFLVTLSPTKVPRGYEEDKNFSQNFRYYWKVKAAQPIKAPSNRAYAENTPFFNLIQLMDLSPNISHNHQYSVHFTNQDRETILGLYFQGKLELRWIQHGLNFNQYCAHSNELFHTLAVAPKGKGITYYRQQRYTDAHHSQVGDVLFDSRYRTEYWFDNEKNCWVADHPNKGEIEYPTRQEALKTIKKLKMLAMGEGELSFFIHPYLRWLRDKEGEATKEETQQPFWKVAFTGWLALTGDIFSNLLSTPAFKVNKIKEENEVKPNEKRIYSLSISTNYEYPFSSTFSDLILYTVRLPLLLSYLVTKDGRFNYLHLFSLVSAVAPGAEAEPCYAIIAKYNSGLLGAHERQRYEDCIKRGSGGNPFQPK